MSDSTAFDLDTASGVGISNGRALTVSSDFPWGAPGSPFSWTRDGSLNDAIDRDSSYPDTDLS